MDRSERVQSPTNLKLLYIGARRQEGKIQSYGMATWDCFRVAPEDAAHVSLQEVVDLAHEVGGKNHGFRCSPCASTSTFPLPCIPIFRKGLVMSKACTALGVMRCLELNLSL